MERWGTIIGLFFYPLSEDFFDRNQTAVFLNTEGDILPNVINFQVPRVGIWPKNAQKFKCHTFPRTTLPLYPNTATCIIGYYFESNFAFGMAFTMNYGEPIDNYLRLFHGFLKKELKINFRHPPLPVAKYSQKNLMSMGKREC